MTQYFCKQCGELLFDNGNKKQEYIYDDICLKCKYGKE